MGSYQPEPLVKGIKIAIDRGGTFTDIWATAADSDDIVLKLLSVDPGNYADAPTEGRNTAVNMLTLANRRRDPTCFVQILWI